MTTATAALPTGLTQREAEARAARGERNVLPPPTGRTYAEIVRENVLTFINIAIFTLGIALAVLGEPTDALVSLGIVAVNIAVGVVQEIRAKIVLDRIALLVRPAARVLRDGAERDIAPSELVVGDIVRIAAGDQVLADSALVAGGPVEMDEALLTGESAPVTKHVGDTLLSGTFCVAGTALIETRSVGEASLANRLTAGARAFRRIATPLQRHVDTIIRAVLVVAISFALVLVGSWFVERGEVVGGIQIAMVIAGLVPNGLLLASSVAYALAAMRVARKGVLVQQANAIDSMSHVDVLCMDKTGTLTTGHERFARLEPLEAPDVELRALAGAFAASMAARDRTVDAIREGCPAEARTPLREVPFSAARRWSAVELARDGALVLGAPEALLPFVSSSVERVAAAVEARTAEGLRVMVLARSTGLSATEPGALRPLGLVCLAEDARPDARATVERFTRAAIAIKLISGDHPNTLRAIARATGLDEDRVATGAEIDLMNEEALRECVRTTALFARTTPHQKERLIRAIRADGSYTAMLGDGINDVLALKAANLGISLRGGASSARAVADMLLLNDEIGALVPAAAEGRRILRGMRDILRVFLTRVLYAALVIAALAVIEGAFPFTPTQNALLTLLTVGIPSIALAAWAPAEPIGADDLGSDLARIVVPAGWTIALLGFAAYVVRLFAGGDFRDASSTLTTICVIAGLLFVVFVVDDTGERFMPSRSDLRRVVLAALMLAAYLAVLATPATRSLFDLEPPTFVEVLLTACGSIVWLVALRWLLHVHALDVVLGLRRSR